MEIWWNFAREKYNTRNPEASYIRTIQWVELNIGSQKDSTRKESMPSESIPECNVVA